MPAWSRRKEKKLAGVRENLLFLSIILFMWESGALDGAVIAGSAQGERSSRKRCCHVRDRPTGSHSTNVRTMSLNIRRTEGPRDVVLCFEHIGVREREDNNGATSFRNSDVAFSLVCWRKTKELYRDISPR